MPLVYLDNCALQRPLDDRNQFRVRVEADAVTAVISAVEDGRVRLATSAALRAEGSRSPHPGRREFAGRVLGLATADVGVKEDVTTLMRTYEQAGLAPFDALHLASAVSLGADFFCSTDDRLLRRAQRANTRGTRIVTPVELAVALGL